MIRDLAWAAVEAAALTGFLAAVALWGLLVTGGLPV